MSLGIVGVCIGDVGFTSRPYNTNLGNPAQRVRDKQKNVPLKGLSHVKEGPDIHLRNQQENPHLIEEQSNASQASSRWKTNEIKDEEAITTNTKNGTRYIYVGGSDINENKKTENEYSSTPTRASLQRCVVEENKKPSEDTQALSSTSNTPFSTQNRKAKNFLQTEDSFSKSKWQLVADRLKANRQVATSGQNSIKDRPKFSKSLNSSPKLDTSYGPPKYLYQDHATEVRTNPQPIPATLFDPSIFYITASKFCPCEHHDQLRKIQEQKIALARKARRKAERLKRKERRRKRKTGSLTLSRSSSESASSLGNGVGKRASTVDILPSIPSLTLQSIEFDHKENDKRESKIDLTDDAQIKHQSVGGNYDRTTIQKGDEIIPKVVISRCSSPVSSSGPTEEPNNGFGKASEIASRVIEPVILDGCDTTNSIQNTIAKQTTTTEFKHEREIINNHRKLSREGGNWTLRPISSLKHEASCEITDPNNDKTHVNKPSKYSLYDKHNTAIHLRSSHLKLHRNNEVENTDNTQNDSPDAFQTIKSSKVPRNPTPTPSTFKKAKKEEENEKLQNDLKQHYRNDHQHEGRASRRAFRNRISPNFSDYQWSADSIYPTGFHHNPPGISHPPRALSEFTNFRGQRQHFMPYMNPMYGAPPYAGYPEDHNYLLRHYTASQFKRRNSQSFPAIEKDTGPHRSRHFSDSLARTQYPYPLTNERLSDNHLPPHYLKQIQYLNQLQQTFDVQNDHRQSSPSISLSLSTSSLSDTSSETSSLRNFGEEKAEDAQSESNNKHRRLSMQISQNTYQNGTRLLRESVSTSHPFVLPQLPQCIQNIILQHHWHLTRAPELPEAREKHLKKLSKHIMLPDDPEDPAAFTLTPELVRPPRKPWCSSKPIPKIVGTFAFLMTCGIIAVILYANYSSNMFKPMK